MRLLTTVALIGVCALCGIESVDTSTRSPPRNSPSQSALSGSLRKGQKGTIVSDFGGLKGAKSARGRSSTSAEIGKTGNGRVQGNTRNGQKFAIQRNRSPTGEKLNSVAGAFQGPRSNGPRALNGVLHKNAGAEVNTETKRGNKNSEIQWEKNANGQLDVDMSAEGKRGEAHGYGPKGNDRYDFKTARGGKWDIDPSTQTRSNGRGTIKADSVRNRGDGDYVYIIKQNGRSETQASLKDSNPSAGRSGFEWNCVGQKAGSQTCKNARGETVGRSQCDDQGYCRVYDKRDRLIGRGETEKVGNKHYVVHLNKPENQRRASGLYDVEIKNWKNYDCYREITRKRDPNPNDVKIYKEFEFEYNKRKSGNTTTFKFPDCYEMSGVIELAPNIEIEDTALEFQVRVNPVGDYKCSSAPSSGRECYFFGMCDEESVRWEYANKNTDNSEVCNAVGGRRYKISMTVCPPPDDEVPICGKFERSFSSNYWSSNKADTLVSRVLIWHRPREQTQIEYNYFWNVEQKGDSFKQSVQAQALAKGFLGGQGVTKTYTDFELLNTYVRQQLIALDKNLKEELLMCRGGKADWNMAGSKVGGKFLIGAADTLQAKGGVESNIYGKPICKDVAEIQAEEYKRLEDNWKAAGKPRGKSGLNLGSISGGGGIFGGGGGGGLGGLFGGK